MNPTAALARKAPRNFLFLLALCLAFATAALPLPAQVHKPETHMSAADAQKLFALVDQLLKFSSDETGLAIKSSVKRELTTRDAVESYLTEKFNEDEGAKRMQRSEIVLKKFGLLERDFDLKPFLLSLLKEQIEAYYDPKTKTVNLLDWVAVDEQKPVLAHELTHALQDQRVDLEKWSDQTPPDVSLNADDDTTHLTKDELDTARESVTEGQATAVMMENMLKPFGRSLLKDPEIVEKLKEHMNASDDSPILARAPLLLSESLVFPYREGLSFEQDLWMDQGQTAAFAGALDRPPTSSWEIMNPREYEKGHHAPIPLLPNIHPLLDADYKPYDIGQVGQLDVHILTNILGGEKAARDLTPAWNGGIYWAGQRRSATEAEKGTTGSIALLYLSAWKSDESARSFAKLYGDSLGRKYSGLHVIPGGSAEEQIYSTTEGPVVVFTRGEMVFVTEGFELELARKLAPLVFDAQGAGELRLARLNSTEMAAPPTLSGSMVRFLSHCGVMKAAVDAAQRAAQQ